MQALRSWYAKMDSFLLDTGFSRCHYNPNVYNKKVENNLIILILNVDNFIRVGSDHNLLTHVKYSLRKKIEMINLGNLHCFLGLQVLETKE